MQSLIDSVLLGTDRIIARLGVGTTLIEAIVERIAPQIRAQACSGVPCVDQCIDFCNHQGVKYHTTYYASTVANCNQGNYNCSTSVCECL